MVTVKTSYLDGKAIAYHSETEFLIQIGHGNGSYRTRFKVTGNLGQAVLFYNGLNIGNGYKKRLLMPSCSKNPIIAREIS